MKYVKLRFFVYALFLWHRDADIATNCRYLKTVCR